MDIQDILYFRMAERLALTVVIVLVSLIVMVSFWRTVQKIDLTDGGKLGLAGSFAFSTPVFVLLTIIGYAWVSLSNEIMIGENNAAMMGAGQRVETDPELQALLREMRTEKQRLRHLPIAPMTFRGSRKSFGRSIVPRVSRICRNPSSAGW